MSLEQGEDMYEVPGGRLRQMRDALIELRDEMANFARYSDSVVAGAAGQNRLTWQERAEWAERLATVARDALEPR